MTFAVIPCSWSAFLLSASLRAASASDCAAPGATHPAWKTNQRTTDLSPNAFTPYLTIRCGCEQHFRSAVVEKAQDPNGILLPSPPSSLCH